MTVARFRPLGLAAAFALASSACSSSDDSAGGVDSAPIDSGTFDSAIIDPIDSPASDAATDALPPVDPSTRGLVVVSGEVAASGSAVEMKLVVLDPTTGREFTTQPRETMTVVNALYDGNRDLWYIFENTTGLDHVQPAPDDVIDMHVRAWDYAAGTWKSDIATLKAVPTPASRNWMTVLGSEIAYVSFTGTGTETALALLRTDVPTAPTLVGSVIPMSGSMPIGLLGVRAVGGGGNLGVLRVGTCASTGKDCPIELTHYVASPGLDWPTLDTALGTKVVGVVDIASTNPSFGAGIDREPFMFIGIPKGGAGATHGSAQMFDPTTISTSGSSIEFDYPEASKFFRDMAIDECDGVLFIPELLSQKVHVVPLAAPTVAIDVNLGNPAQATVWEPYTKTMFAPYKQGIGSDVAAYRVDVDAGTKAAKLTRRTADWDYPNDLRPNVVVAKSPVGFACK